MRLMIAILMAIGLAAPVTAQSKPGLPIAEGLWVNTAENCATAESFWAYHGFSFDSITSGTGGVNLPHLGYLVRTNDGFIRINGGPIEVKANPNGTATVRAYSAAEGEIWRETVRRCQDNELSDWMRGKAESIRTNPTAPAVYVPEVANGSWRIGGSGTDRLALYSGDGLIESIALGCADQDSVTIGVKLRRTAPIDATRLDLNYVDNGQAGGTAIYRVSDDNQWIGAFEGMDSLDTQSTIIFDMGPAGAEQISLKGSRAAIRPALAACWVSER